MYNKGGYLLRVETTINNPGLPGAKLHKPVYDIKGYYWYGHGCNNRFLEALSEVDSSQLSETSTKYTETLITEKGKRIAAPDLRQKKQLSLVAVLLNCRYSSEWFRVKDLIPCLSGDYSKPAEIRYQLQKLKERGLLEKRQGANYYRVTREGYIWLYVSYCQIRYFVSPLLSTTIEKGIRQKMDSLDEFEKAVKTIHDGLSSIYQQLNIAA
jgi:predicted transcriptional regulator